MEVGWGGEGTEEAPEAGYRYRVQVQDTGTKYRVQVQGTGTKYRVQGTGTGYRYRVQVQSTGYRYWVRGVTSKSGSFWVVMEARSQQKLAPARITTAEDTATATQGIRPTGSSKNNHS